MYIHEIKSYYFFKDKFLLALKYRTYTEISYNIYKTL